MTRVHLTSDVKVFENGKNSRFNEENQRSIRVSDVQSHLKSALKIGNLACAITKLIEILRTGEARGNGA